MVDPLVSYGSSCGCASRFSDPDRVPEIHPAPRLAVPGRRIGGIRPGACRWRRKVFVLAKSWRPSVCLVARPLLRLPLLHSEALHD